MVKLAFYGGVKEIKDRIETIYDNACESVFGYMVRWYLRTDPSVLDKIIENLVRNMDLPVYSALDFEGPTQKQMAELLKQEFR